MKPFNLEAVRRGDKVVTKDGEVPIEVVVMESPLTYPVVAVFKDVDGETYTRTFTSSGREFKGCDSPNDLVMATTKKTVYVNLYPKGVYHAYNLRESAEIFAESDAIAIAAPITIEE